MAVRDYTITNCPECLYSPMGGRCSLWARLTDVAMSMCGYLSVADYSSGCKWPISAAEADAPYVGYCAGCLV